MISSLKRQDVTEYNLKNSYNKTIKTIFENANISKNSLVISVNNLTCDATRYFNIKKKSKLYFKTESNGGQFSIFLVSPSGVLLNKEINTDSNVYDFKLNEIGNYKIKINAVNHTARYTLYLYE